MSNDPEHHRPRSPHMTTGEFVAGSPTWEVDTLRRGKSLLTDDASDSIRRACARAIAKVVGREPQRAYDLSLWYAVHHTGQGESFPFLKLKRLA